MAAHVARHVLLHCRVLWSRQWCTWVVWQARWWWCCCIRWHTGLSGCNASRSMQQRHASRSIGCLLLLLLL